MSQPTTVSIPGSIYKIVSSWAEKAYPHEGCGLLIGRFGPDGEKQVVRFAALTNELLSRTPAAAPTLPPNRRGPGAGRTEFVIDPDEFNRETLEAEKEGLDVVGIVHTHPDHPPHPSQIDAAQPFLAQWSNVIVAVHQGKLKEMKSWFRESDEMPFSEELIKISSL